MFSSVNQLLEPALTIELEIHNPNFREYFDLANSWAGAGTKKMRALCEEHDIERT